MGKREGIWLGSWQLSLFSKTDANTLDCWMEDTNKNQHGCMNKWMRALIHLTFMAGIRNAPEILSLEQSTSSQHTMEESGAGAVQSGELRFTGQWGCAKHCGDRCPIYSAWWHWVVPQKGDDMWRKNKIYLLTKMGTFQSTARHKDPTTFPILLPRAGCKDRNGGRSFP